MKYIAQNWQKLSSMRNLYELARGFICECLHAVTQGKNSNNDMTFEHEAKSECGPVIKIGLRRKLEDLNPRHSLNRI